MFLKQLRISIIAIVLFTIVAGIIYPLVVTGVAQLLFPRQANGSLFESNGKTIGSTLIGQPFRSPQYFWSRISATAPFAYNAGASSGSNLGPLNPALFDMVRKRIQELRAADSGSTKQVPVDLVTSSASGLDPHISVAAAYYQISRVARARGMNEDSLRVFVDRYTTGRQFGFLGEAVVNVLQLNLALDGNQSVRRGK